jgi:hypothetical protein
MRCDHADHLLTNGSTAVELPNLYKGLFDIIEACAKYGGFYLNERKD